MTEKVRTFNLPSGNLSSLNSTSSTTPTVRSTIIGAPTLISSTFNSSVHTEELAHVGIVGGGDVAITNASNYMESSTDLPACAGVITAQLNFQLLPTDSAGDAVITGMTEVNSIMNTSQLSATSNDTSYMQLPQSPAATSSGAVAKLSSGSGKHLVAQSVAGKNCRFPKLEECAHFHYERVQLGPLSVQLLDDKSEQLTNSIASQSIGGDIAQTQSGSSNSVGIGRSFSPTNCWFIIRVCPQRYEPFLVKRSFENMQMFDEMLHRCVYDRKISGLRNMQDLEFKNEEDVEYAVAKYLERFSKIASDSLTCGTILTWLQLDNKGRRLPLADGETQRTINTPAVGAAYGVRRYQAQAPDEISIEVGDMISVIDMPSPAESIWWRGKKSHLQKSHYEVGFFPQSCVATIGDKVPRNFPMPAPLVGQLDVSPTKPVLRKHGKLIAFFRSFILSRPSRRRLKQSGIYRERVFSCDLSEHLLNSGQEIPMVLKSCAEFIENYGIIDGIYRLSGITSNIQRLRRAFDEERVPDLGNPEMKQDIHAVSSLLKMYFRELPNPLCTYQLYDNFVEAIQVKSESEERLRLMKETVLKLPPPHYRTLKYLSEHLNKISQHHERTGMTDKNLAIVWAPNLLRSPALESGGVAALRGVGVQAVVTEYLIRNCHDIFDALDDSNARLSYIATAGVMTSSGEQRLDSLTDCESLLVEQREHDQASIPLERPKSLSAGGAKLISLEEAQERHSRVEGFDIKQSMPINMMASNAANIGSYIEVGGGPSSLPDKYHTVLSAPRSWQKRKTHSWKSLFSRNQRPISNGSVHENKPNICIEEAASTHRKEPTLVTFAESDSIIINPGKLGKGLSKQDKPKSIELFETTRDIISKPMEACVRSNSIDSLRTAGHSRSVSHDSYFDLLQSPQRGVATSCPSRELSELGINFDREEPEMRIFSESESLVSSPRVGKENIPPSSGVASRRIMRARPEEFSSQTNSVNPSPKKQPRLNLLLSPSSAVGPSNNWSHSAVSAEGVEACVGHERNASNESCCKRYKLEDQLSDIQYIDCGTPEHMNANPQTLYTSVQVHVPPKSSLSKASLHGSKEEVAVPKTSTGRYSYPIVQLGSKRKDQDGIINNSKERFSYPGSTSSNDRYSAKLHSDYKADPSLTGSPHNRTVSICGSKKSSIKQDLATSMHLPDILRNKNHKDCFTGNQEFNLSLRTNTLEPSSALQCGELKERSKLSVTPSSPMHSPRYSLLVGDTSSENSSAVTTPQYDLDPLLITSTMSGLSGISGASNQQQQLLLGVDSNSCMGTSRESLSSNFITNCNDGRDNRDMQALKRELSLDLQPIVSKMPVDHVDTANRAATLPSKQYHQHMMPSPNNSNITDNTSQSVTPSEFGYQHLQRQLSMHSLIETDENSVAYDDYENTPSNLCSPIGISSDQKLPSPIKSTISITYNLKSPCKEQQTDKHSTRKALLETSFDENTVYEQVKLFRNSVTEVNQLLRENPESFQNLENVAEVEEKEMDLSIMKAAEMSNELLELASKDEIVKQSRKSDIELDVQMQESSSRGTFDPMANSNAEEVLLYENVELRKPKTVYENLLGEEMKVSLVDSQHENDKNNDKIELDSLESIKTTDSDKMLEAEHVIHRKSPSNFSVKELATKFESSPVEQLPAFDFSIRNSMKKAYVSHELKPIEVTKTQQQQQQQQQQQHQQQHQHQHQQYQQQQQSYLVPDKSLKKKLNKSQQITRSLDESAFVREFGGKQLHDLQITQSSQQLPEQTEVSNRRKSFDFTRPKMLNPPKRLPGMPITEEICIGRSDNKSLHCTNSNSNSNNVETQSNDQGSIEQFKITPTTENRISLIQNNVSLSTSAVAAADLNNSNMNLKGVLSGVKLDRERIDRIKEERRQQLTQKYHTESLKSRSKTDLNSTSKEDEKKFHTESMRVKSKSRGDMNSIQKDIENSRQFGQTVSSCLHAGSENTLNSTSTMYGMNRVRSISDEKNQNCDTLTTTIAATTDNNDVSTNTKSSNSNILPKSTATATATANIQKEFSARATAQKFERKTLDITSGSSSSSSVSRDRTPKITGAHDVLSNNGTLIGSRNSNLSSTREKISPQFSIRDMTAMFESRSQNQQ